MRAYNLGSGAPIDLAGLVRGLAAAASVSPIVTSAPVPTGDVDATFADIRRANDELGWSPRIRLEDGLQTVFGWIRENP
jgi:nucleoside-diphosphate-sugar epimerase